jgi:hypothetical protein
MPYFNPSRPTSPQALAPGSSRSVVVLLLRMLYQPWPAQLQVHGQYTACCCPPDQMPTPHGCHTISHCCPRGRSLTKGCLPAVAAAAAAAASQLLWATRLQDTVARGLAVLLLLLLLCCCCWRCWWLCSCHGCSTSLPLPHTPDSRVSPPHQPGPTACPG